MSMLDSVRNIFSIPELRKRGIFTLALLAVYRAGGQIPNPGISSAALAEFWAAQKGTILGFIDLFSGRYMSKMTIFALGIMPYISSSIILQLLGAVVPYFQKLSKEGEEVRKKLNQLTRYGTVVVSALQGWGVSVRLLSLNLEGQPIVPAQIQGIAFTISTVIFLTTGTMFMMWLGEQITERGIGNGISLIIFIGIIARFPHSIIDQFRVSQNLVLGLLILGVMVAIIAGVVMVTQGIFAQSIMFIPSTILTFFPESEFMQSLSGYFQYTSFTYSFFYGLMIIFFTYFYTAIAFNPKDVSENMQKQGGFIPGIRPGKHTSEFIDNILTKITLPGSIFLAIIAILPAFMVRFGVTASFAQFFGGTSLLIMVGVALDTLQQVESHLLMRHYDGFMKSGKMKGRNR